MTQSATMGFDHWTYPDIIVKTLLLKYFIGVAKPPCLLWFLQFMINRIRIHLNQPSYFMGCENVIFFHGSPWEKIVVFIHCHQVVFWLSPQRLQASFTLARKARSLSSVIKASTPWSLPQESFRLSLSACNSKALSLLLQEFSGLL